MKNIAVRILIVIGILIPVAAIAHYAVFPQTTRCMLIGLSDFQKHDGIYFSSQTNAATQNTVVAYVYEGEKRIESLFGSKTGNPVIIYCNTIDEFHNYGADGNNHAVTQLSVFGEYVVINGSLLDSNIIAHEMCHAELQSQIGWYRRTTQIPTWFDEGLAMQVDWRSDFSEDSLQAAILRGAQLPKITTMKTTSLFNGGNDDDVWLNYATAKLEIAKWYSMVKLKSLITMLNNGYSFDVSYRQ